MSAVSLYTTLNTMMNEIRMLIREIVGYVVDVGNVSKILTNSLFDIMNKSKNDIKSYHFNTYSQDYEFPKLIDFTSDFFDEINVELRVYKSSKQTNEVSGSFDDIRTEKSIKFPKKYNVELVLKIYNWDYETDLTKEIESVLNHELQHAFNYAKKDDKPTSTKILNSTRNAFKQPFYVEKYKMFPDFKEFLDVFYLNLPEEQDARIHQLYHELLKYKTSKLLDMVNIMKGLKSFKDFERIRNFKNNFKEIPLEIKREFVNDFHNILQNNKEKSPLNNLEVNYPKDVDKFFEYWTNQFHYNAEILIKKAFKIPFSIREG